MWTLTDVAYLKMQYQPLAVTLATVFTLGAPCAHAQMFINTDRTGEALLFPFYSAANGNDTYIHIANTTDWVKVARVRLHEAHNGAEVFSFNLYLPPHDHWSAAITVFPDDDGAALVTVDTSCTVPELGVPNPPFDGTIVDEGYVIVRSQPLVNFDYLDDAPNDGIERTLQGYIEVIEMGQLASGPAPDNFTQDLNVYLTDHGNDKGHAATHGASGVPNGCEKLVNAWASPGGTWINDPGDELLNAWQGGGLYGYATLINVEDGTAAGYDAIAIDGFIDPAATAGAAHQPADSAEPNWRNGVASISLISESGISQYMMNDGVDAVSGLLMSGSIMNDFVADPGIRGITDWILTQPTKRFYTDWPSRPPYTESWNGSSACEEIASEFWDREELFTEVRRGVFISPAPPGWNPEPINLCTAVTVASFGENSALRATDDILLHYNGTLGGVRSGWSQFDFINDAGHYLESNDGHIFFGLPIAGFAVFSYRNDDASEVVPGVLAAYASAEQHRRHVYVQYTGTTQ